MAGILRRLPGAGLLREAYQATQLAGALAEKKKRERALVLAEQNAAMAPYRGARANDKMKELFDQEKYGEMAQLFVPTVVYKTGSDLISVWWKTWDIYWIFLFIRIFLVFFGPSGYIHPDEYFQTVEVITGDVFGTRTTRTWEFNTTSPLRSITLNMVVFGVPLYLVNFLDYVFNFVTGWTIIGPYLIGFIPRFVMLLLSFISDYTTYQICILYKANFNQCLTTLASSYVMLIYSTRTFSNSIEMALVSILFYMVGHCLKRTSETVYLHAMVHESYVKAETPREKVEIKKKEKQIPPHDFKYFLQISILCGVGFFNRPTFLAFAIVPLFYWFQRGVSIHSVVTPFQMFNCRILSMAPGFLITIFTIVLVDSLYYGDLTLKKIWLLTMSWDDWKCTPFNFIMYNVVPGNLDQHGTHPHWLHALVNLQILYGPMGIVALYTSINFIAEIILNDWKNKPPVITVGAMSFFTFIVSLGILSIFPHQEPRFLIPLTVPIVIMNAHKLRWKCGKYKPLLWIWFIFNITCGIFFGFIHQAGVMPATKYIANDLQFSSSTQEANFIWSHTYMPPTFQMLRQSERSKLRKKNRNRTDQDFPSYYLHTNISVNFYDLGGKDIFSDVKKDISTLSTRAKLRKKTVENFIILPNHLISDLIEATENEDKNLKFETKAHFCPHISTENPPNSIQDLNHLFVTIMENPKEIIDEFVEFCENFCLALVKFDSSSLSIKTKSTIHS